jgi:hypothetical protein
MDAGDNTGGFNDNILSAKPERDRGCFTTIK